MDILNNKLNLLKEKINNGKSIKVAIIGLGSVGNYLLNYLNKWEENNIEIYIGGRNVDKATKDVNISKVASLIRDNKTKNIHIKQLDLENIESIKNFLIEIKPDFVVNSSRVYSGLKYGSISWKTIRAYGLWAPLAIKYIKNIMEAYKQASSNSIVINTSYSDAVIPWLKSAEQNYPDFGSGNLNHLIPRIKMAAAEFLKENNLSDIDVILATSHFHDVVISKEGQTEGVSPLIKILQNGKEVSVDLNEIWKKCAIEMPVDAKRNMMNASSNFEIIKKIVIAIKTQTKQIIHTPGVVGNIGGYPILIDGNTAKASFYEKYFSKEEMTEANRKSIYFDGIEKIENGSLFYTDELIIKVKKAFDVDIPKEVPYSKIEEIASYIIKNIIEPQLEIK